jgi:hypothetical protein
MELHCVIYVCQLGNWEKSFHFLISALSKSGLYDKLKTIHVLCTNPTMQTEKSAYFVPSKLTVINAGDPKHYERPALWFCKNYTFPEGAKVLYLHTKGLRWWGTAREKNVEDWVHLMIHWNIYKWKDAIITLDDYDTYGCNHVNNDKPSHYSGNFWWATSSHLRSCEETIGDGYNDPEYWVLKNPKTKWFSAFQSGLEGMGHYDTPFPLFRQTFSPTNIVILHGHVGECTFADLCRSSKETYANIHGYQFYHEPASSFPGDTLKSYHMHFWRSLIVQRAAAAHPNSQWFVWLDSDMYVNKERSQTRLEDLVEFDPWMLYYTTHEKPWGIDLINTGFKVIHREALKYEEEIWSCRDTMPWNTFTFEQLTLWNKIFPQIPGRYCIKDNKELNCLIKAYKTQPDVLKNGVFMHMCNMTLEERNSWADTAKKNGSML